MVTEPSEFIQRLKDIQENGESTVLTTLPSDEPRFVIDADTRIINIPDEFTFLSVKNDHKAETIYFEIDRYFDDVDLSEYTCVVQFSHDKNTNEGGISPVTAIDTTTLDGKLIMGWKIANDATRMSGDIYFAVRFYSVDDNNRFTYNFNTAPAKSVILDTLDIDDTYIVESYPSTIQAIMDMLKGGEKVSKAGDSMTGDLLMKNGTKIKIGEAIAGEETGSVYYDTSNKQTVVSSKNIKLHSTDPIDIESNIRLGTPSILTESNEITLPEKDGTVVLVEDMENYTKEKIAELVNGAPETMDTLKEISDAIAEHKDVEKALNEAIGKKANQSDLSSHENASNPHNITKSVIGLGKVENKSSEDIRGELTSENVTNALGYTPGTSSSKPITYTLSKDGATISLTSSEGVSSSVTLESMDSEQVGINKEDISNLKKQVESKLGKTEQASDSATVNGHTVESNVPANAQFTDTVPEVDAELSETSTNAVQNKVVNAAIAKKADTILYDKSANTLYLKSGSTVLSSTEIKSGGGGATIAPKPTVNPQIKNDDGKVIITWEDPTNTVIDGSTFSTWSGTKLVMKEDGYPTSPDDGTLLVDNTTRDKYKVGGFVKSGLTNNKQYYFALFPYSTDGIYNYDSGNRLLGEPVGLKIVTFAGGTDEEIVKMIQAHYNNKIDISNYWAVGDTRSVNLSAMSATGVGESHRAQTVQFVIGDFKHDDLVTPIHGHEKAAITLLQKDCLMDATSASDSNNGSKDTEKGYMNSTGSNVGGWRECARRTWCNNVYFNALPSALQSIVKTVDKKVSAGNNQPTIGTVQDKIFLAAEIEIFGSITSSYAGEGTQYQYYKNATANRYKMPRRDSNSVSQHYWERSPSRYGTGYFSYYSEDMGYTPANINLGIAPCLCI